jgi:hypothetical protein
MKFDTFMMATCNNHPTYFFHRNTKIPNCPDMNLSGPTVTVGQVSIKKRPHKERAL